ncbi:ARP2/3 actin-organizing complex subunit Arc5 [Ranunculus cassubicifolius]
MFLPREEIVNACGVEDIHDGTNYSRIACVIVVAKARDTFEPFLHQLGFRLLHILKRLLRPYLFIFLRKKVII